MVFTKVMPSGKGRTSSNSSDSSSGSTSSGSAANPPPAPAKAAGPGGGAGQRTTFRPPWVKEGPQPIPVPAVPWSLKNTTRRDSGKEAENPLAGVQLRKTSIVTKEPQENGAGKENSFKKPQLKPVPPKDDAEKPRKEHNLPPVKLNSVADRIKNEASRKPPLQRIPTISKDEEIDRAIPAARHALVREESMRRLSHSQTPAPPPMPPPAPALPENFEKKDLSKKQKAKIDQLKNRPKVRPDWSNLLQEIESKKKLKHVQCNDRSQPLLPDAKETEHFLYESETPNVHNVLLKQIQGGIRLKKVQTNDRSKPVLEGLNKFRRQMTIEEQIQKSMSMASIPPDLQDIAAAEEVDEMDDIDRVRDDLQSTKQMLALEMRNKEAQIRENKRLLARIQNLEAELEKEKSKKGDDSSASSNNTKSSNSADDKLIQSLKKEAEQARKSSEEVEHKYKDVSEQLDTTKLQLEEQRKQNQQLEKKLQEMAHGKRQSISKDVNGGAPESEDEIIMSDLSEAESDGEETEEKKERRVLRDLKIMRNKLRNFKNKEDNAKKERMALKEIMKRHQAAIKEEKKKFKILQKEVDKMAALMKDDADEDEEESEEEAEEVEEEEEESSEESESDDSDDDSDSERSQSEAEDAPADKKKANLTARANRHENILAALKKGNMIMKTNAERLQDDLNKQKEATALLQRDLDSVLAELG